MIIDQKVLTEPRQWLVSKINRLSTNGLVLVTLTQDPFDQHKDFIEFDEFGNIVGMWADYYDSNIEPVKPLPQDFQFKSKLIHSGKDPVIKVKGSYKTITAHFYNEADEEIEPILGEWEYYLNDELLEDPSSLFMIKSDDNYQIKIKYIGTDDNLNKVLTVKYKTENTIAFIKLEIVGL